jgi:hypothetical protein
VRELIGAAPTSEERPTGYRMADVQSVKTFESLVTLPRKAYRYQACDETSQRVAWRGGRGDRTTGPCYFIPNEPP